MIGSKIWKGILTLTLLLSTSCASIAPMGSPLQVADAEELVEVALARIQHKILIRDECNQWFRSILGTDGVIVWLLRPELRIFALPCTTDPNTGETFCPEGYADRDHLRIYIHPRVAAVHDLEDLERLILHELIHLATDKPHPDVDDDMRVGLHLCL